MAKRNSGHGGDGGKSRSSSMPATGGGKADFRPSRDDILRYIADNPDKSGKREIAKAFSLKGESRVWLKDLLRDLQ
ncbi:MAG: hypothetical protein WBA88_03620, partial [Pseudaminobacter sp.]